MRETDDSPDHELQLYSGCLNVFLKKKFKHWVAILQKS